MLNRSHLSKRHEYRFHRSQTTRIEAEEGLKGRRDVKKMTRKEGQLNGRKCAEVCVRPSFDLSQCVRTLTGNEFLTIDSERRILITIVERHRLQTSAELCALGKFNISHESNTFNMIFQLCSAN